MARQVRLQVLLPKRRYTHPERLMGEYSIKLKAPTQKSVCRWENDQAIRETRVELACWRGGGCDSKMTLTVHQITQKDGKSEGVVMVWTGQSALTRRNGQSQVSQ